MVDYWVAELPGYFLGVCPTMGSSPDICSAEGRGRTGLTFDFINNLKIPALAQELNMESQPTSADACWP
jgi:hypothetical protein